MHSDVPESSKGLKFDANMDLFLLRQLCVQKPTPRGRNAYLEDPYI